MATTIITINKSAITDRVARQTGYAGKYTDGGIDRVAVTDDESDIIGDYISESLSALASSISEYNPVITTAGISLTTPANYDSGATAAVSAEAETYVVNNVCAQWYVSSRIGDDATICANRAKDNLANINILLSRRLKP